MQHQPHQHLHPSSMYESEEKNQSRNGTQQQTQAAPLSSLSFMLEASLAQLQLEVKQHVSALVYGSLTLTDFLSYSPFLSYSTLQGLLCFSAHRLNEIITFIMRMRDNTIQLNSPPTATNTSNSSTVNSSAINMSYAEPAKNILLLRTILILASHVHYTDAHHSHNIHSQTQMSTAIAVLLTPHSPLPSPLLSLSSSLCSFLSIQLCSSLSLLYLLSLLSPNGRLSWS